MCINASTDKWHTGNGCSCTLVSVPKQECKSNYEFFFQLNSKKQIGIPMVPGVSFLSSMKLLTHRQQCIADRDAPLDPPIIDNFVNVCSYANQRLFTYIRTSMNQNQESNK